MIQKFRLVRATKVVNLTLPSNRGGFDEQVDFVSKQGVSVPKGKPVDRSRGKKEKITA